MNTSRIASSVERQGAGEQSNGPALSLIWYRRPQAAARLGMGLRTLDREIAINEIAVKRVGRSVYITEDEIREFTKRDHKTGSAPRVVQ
jgi:hypothetical protein